VHYYKDILSVWQVSIYRYEFVVGCGAQEPGHDRGCNRGRPLGVEKDGARGNTGGES